MSAIGGIGVWIRTDAMTAQETAGLARQVEALGYGAFWFPEIRGRNAFVQNAGPCCQAADAHP